MFIKELMPWIFKFSSGIWHSKFWFQQTSCGKGRPIFFTSDEFWLLLPYMEMPVALLIKGGIYVELGFYHSDQEQHHSFVGSWVKGRRELKINWPLIRFIFLIFQIVNFMQPVELFGWILVCSSTWTFSSRRQDTTLPS